MHEIILSKYFQYSSICLRCCLHFWWHRKYLPILILRDWCLVARRVSVCFMRSRLRIFFLTRILVKTRKFYGDSVNSGDSTKNRYQWEQQKHALEYKRGKIFLILILSTKHVHIGGNFKEHWNQMSFSF